MLVITAGKGNILRMVPPLTITAQDVDKGAKILADSIKAALK